jgi:hypothetical protein
MTIESLPVFTFAKISTMRKIILPSSFRQLFKAQHRKYHEPVNWDVENKRPALQKRRKRCDKI